jgi:hypothetical protein
MPGVFTHQQYIYQLPRICPQQRQFHIVFNILCRSNYRDTSNAPRMRLSTKKCFLLLATIAGFATLCFVAVKPHTYDRSAPRFEFLQHTISSDGNAGFSADHSDGTGGWLTRWFGSNWPTFFPENGQQRWSQRCPVYTYFDPADHHDEPEDGAVLAIWKRVFWALGFNPVILSPEDAKRHRYYSLFRDRRLVGGTGQRDFGMWLAMADRGGLFFDYRVVPYQGRLLTSCRRFLCRLRPTRHLRCSDNARTEHLQPTRP